LGEEGKIAAVEKLALLKYTSSFPPNEETASGNREKKNSVPTNTSQSGSPEGNLVKKKAVKQSITKKI